MNKRPGQIKVTVETAYCSFCDRTRNLRREERHLGALVRTVVSCESCHRLLSSSIGVAPSAPVVEATIEPVVLAADDSPEEAPAATTSASPDKPKRTTAKPRTPKRPSQPGT